MAFSSNPFALKNLTLDAQELRQALASLLPDTGGIVQAGDLAVAQTPTASMTVNVTPGRIWIPGTNTANLAGETFSAQGQYFGFNDANIPCLIGTANATNPRIDVIYAYVKDTALGGTSDIIGIGIAAGTPAATPAVPAMPSNINAVSLAQVAVAANATSITTANITQTAPKIIGAPNTVANPFLQPQTNFNFQGNAFVTQLNNGLKQVTVDLTILRINSNFAVNTTKVNLLQILPNAAVGSGNMKTVQSGFFNSTGAVQVSVKPSTGEVFVSSTTALTWNMNDFVTINCTYFI